MSDRQEQLYVWPTVLLAILSTICDLYVIFSILKQKVELTFTLGPESARLSYDYLFFRLMNWMAGTDILYCLSYGLSVIVALEIDVDEDNFDTTSDNSSLNQDIDSSSYEEGDLTIPATTQASCLIGAIIFQFCCYFWSFFH